jgi:hypothetical protein
VGYLKELKTRLEIGIDSGNVAPFQVS